MAIAANVFAQNSTPTSQSNPSSNFSDYLAGVKYAEVVTTPDFESKISANPNRYQVYLGVGKYLESMDFLNVGFSSKIGSIKTESICDVTKVVVTYDVNGAYVKNFTVTFWSCDGEWWQFKSKKTIIDNGYVTVTDKTAAQFRKMYGYKKRAFKPSYRRSIPKNMTSWTEEKIKQHFIDNGADAIEGIYEKTSEDPLMARYKVAVVKEDNEYRLIYLGGAINSADWEEGEVKASLIKTATSSLFKLKWFMANKSVNEDPYATFETGIMNVIFPNQDKGIYIKLYPTADDNVSVSNNSKSSGTGFAISSDGYIVTNYHVTQGASNISVRGVKGDFSKTFKAKVIVEDKNNDLAIIKIEDTNFTNCGTPPYKIDRAVKDVGTSVYALGYPLRATMGDEVKLTNGIISSKSGFQGDITTYQISVPVQPGNSGGPLFDSQGNVVGIINAKHLGAENASYSIKTSYLMSLIEVMNESPALPNSNTISSKNLADQVKFIKEFIYIIEIN